MIAESPAVNFNINESLKPVPMPFKSYGTLPYIIIDLTDLVNVLLF